MHFSKKNEKFIAFRLIANIHFRQKSFRKKLRIYILFLYGIDGHDIFIIHKKTRTAVTKKSKLFSNDMFILYRLPFD